eukprot:Gb_00456 [translate_table: standard]
MVGILERTLIHDLVANKGALISVPENAKVHQVLKIMDENEITALPIASAAEQQALAGETSLVQESAHYIGIVSMLDVVLHIGENLDHAEDVLETPVSDLIGHTSESRSLWTVSPNAKLSDAMDYLCKGVHRFLVPIKPEAASHEATQYRLLTQTDVVSFLLMHVDELGLCASRTVSELGLLHPDLLALAVPSNMTLFNALRLMHQKTAFSSLAVVEPSEEQGGFWEAHPRWVRGGKLVGSLSANYFRGLGLEDINSLKPEMSVAEFLKMSVAKGFSRPLVTVRPTTPLATAMEASITNKVHRVWVTDEDAWLLGVVSFSDIIGAARREPSSFVQR